MADIASLAISISANANAFNSAIEKAASKAEKFADNVGHSVDKLAKPFQRGQELFAKLARGVGGLISVIANPLATIEGGFQSLFDLISNEDGAFGRIRDIAKLSEQTGVTIKTIAGLELAGKRAGVEFDDLRDSVISFSQSMGDLRADALFEKAGEKAKDFGRDADFALTTSGRNATGAARAIEELGLKLDDLNALSDNDRFLKVVDALQKVEDLGLRQSAGTKLFGEDDFTKIFRAIDKGTNFKELADDADRLGYVFSRLEANKVIEAQRAVADLGAAFEGLKRQAAIAISPIIVKFTDKLTEFFKRVGAKNVGKLIADGVVLAANYTEKLVNIVVRLAKEFAVVGDAIAKIAKRAGIIPRTFEDKIDKTVKDLQGLNKTTVQVFDGIRFISEKDLLSIDKSELSKAIAKDVDDAVSRIRNFTVVKSGKLFLSEDIKSSADGLDRARKAFLDLQAALERGNQIDLSGLKDFANIFGGDGRRGKTALELLKGRIGEAIAAQDKLQEGIRSGAVERSPLSELLSNEVKAFQQSLAARRAIFDKLGREERLRLGDDTVDFVRNRDALRSIIKRLELEEETTKQLQLQARFVKEAEKFRSSLRTPGQIFRDNSAEVIDAIGRGLKLQDAQDVIRARAQSLPKLATPEKQFASALEVGSQEAITALNERAFADQRNLQKEANDLLNEQLELARQAAEDRRELQRVTGNMERGIRSLTTAVGGR